MITIQINNHDLEVDHADEGLWRSYQLDAMGTNLDDTIADASITEVDQDGGEIATYSLRDARADVFKRASWLIEYTLEQAHRKSREAAREYAVDRAIDEAKGS